ncbi:MAG: M13 family peptidase [Bacteroidetes bacterium]|nr:MAG: M13 family peptidase [Bacteroidota bacterium]
MPVINVIATIKSKNMKRFNFFAMIAIVLLLAYACENKQEKTMTKALDPANMDLNIKPGDDFFRFVNGNWIKNNPVPPEYSSYGAFTVLYEENEKMLQTLVKEVSADKEAAEGSISQKIRDFYNSGMDTMRIEELGITVLQPEFDEINNLQSATDISRHIAVMQQKGLSPLFYLFTAADQSDSKWNIANFWQGGLGLPDVTYYTDESERMQQIREDYKTHITKMFLLKGDDESAATKTAETILAMETDLAKVSKTRMETRIAEENFHKMSLNDLKVLAPGFDWDAYFTALGLPDPGELNVSQTEFMKGMSELIAKYPVEDWRTYLPWHLLDGSANYLSDAFVQQNFDFFGKTLSGSEVLRPRWKRVLATTSGGLGEGLGQIYVERYFPPESKERMVKLVENLRLAFAGRIKKLDWMTDETKEKALAKLEAITVKIGYPDKWKDYSTLNIVPDNYLLNVQNARAFEFKRDFAKIGKKVDKTEWGMTPQTVNAYYNPTNNEIVFPAGILQPPFFNKDADDAVNYGAIGVVIGHEMTHGFDDQGRKYDKDGNMNEWWTDEDAERFMAKAAILAKQYDDYTMLDSLHINGNLTMGENIADMGGLNISYDAFLMALNGAQPEMIDGYSADQRFFMAYAQVWRQNVRDKALMRQLKEDVHSPGEARVNIPPFNMDIFLDAFGISPDDKLYIPKEKRAYIW